MKKILLFGAVMVLVACRLCAQSAIVITEANFPILPGPFHYYTSYPKTLALPANGPNVKWDYSFLKSDSPVTQVFFSNPGTPFTNSKTAIADTGKSEFLTSDNNVKEVQFYDEDKNGLYFAGNYVGNQFFSLEHYFSNSSDNIVVPQQNDSVRVNTISFPETYKTCGHYKAIKSLHFLWTVNSANMTNAPSIKKTYYTVMDTVTGWGTLRVPALTAKSIAYPVLQVKRKVVTIDSYYVNNMAASKFFLIAFGITQGAKTIDCNEYFYRTGHTNPLLTIGFGTDTTYKTPLNVLYSTDSIKDQAGIEENGADNNDFAIYPNPANTGQVNCSFTKENSGQWQILVFNSIGQVFKSETIEGVGKINMKLDINGASNGLYFVNIMGENGQIVANGKLTVNR